MDETYGTYVDDEYFDNHDYDDDTDDDNDHKNDSYTKKTEVLLLGFWVLGFWVLGNVCVVKIGFGNY